MQDSSEHPRSRSWSFRTREVASCSGNRLVAGGGQHCTGVYKPHRPWCHTHPRGLRGSLQRRGRLESTCRGLRDSRPGTAGDPPAGLCLTSLLYFTSLLYLTSLLPHITYIPHVISTSHHFYTSRHFYLTTLLYFTPLLYLTPLLPHITYIPHVISTSHHFYTSHHFHLTSLVYFTSLLYLTSLPPPITSTSQHGCKTRRCFTSYSWWARKNTAYLKKCAY